MSKLDEVLSRLDELEKGSRKDRKRAREDRKRVDALAEKSMSVRVDDDWERRPDEEVEEMEPWEMDILNLKHARHKAAELNDLLLEQSKQDGIYGNRFAEHYSRDDTEDKTAKLVTVFAQPKTCTFKFPDHRFEGHYGGLKSSRVNSLMVLTLKPLKPTTRGKVEVIGSLSVACREGTASMKMSATVDIEELAATVANLRRIDAKTGVDFFEVLSRYVPRGHFLAGKDDFLKRITAEYINDGLWSFFHHTSPCGW